MTPRVASDSRLIVQERKRKESKNAKPVERAGVGKGQNDKKKRRKPLLFNVSSHEKRLI